VRCLGLGRGRTGRALITGLTMETPLAVVFEIKVLFHLVNENVLTPVVPHLAKLLQ
jgi:hypothetical protein